MVFPHKTMNNRNLKPSFFYVTENTNNNEKNFYRKMQLIDSALKRPADTWEVTLSPPVDDLGRCLRDLDLILCIAFVSHFITPDKIVTHFCIACILRFI